MNEQDIMIDVDHISHIYTDENGNDVRALDDVSLSIKRGEFVCIIGTNGSGKSTLAKHFNVLLQPSIGKIRVCGYDTSDENHIWDIRQHVGMVFQNPDNQIVAAVVEEDVAFGPENLGVPSEEIVARVDAALEAVNMTEYREHGPHLLSGGQKQRIAIAGVLAMKPDCIVLDEPTAMLDPKGRREVLETVHKLNKEEGITIVLITHFMEEAVTADRVIVMRNGKKLHDGTPREIFSHVDELKSIGLDVPVASEIAFKLNQHSYALGDSIINNEELADALIKSDKGSRLICDGIAAVENITADSAATAVTATTATTEVNHLEANSIVNTVRGEGAR
ncbi:energy-coupling factor transporter ATPase [Veillonella denticariosi JCM 15641]|uniref:ABC transporter ATP-binding protein n=1 Tax=Veillonella denticariosi JCM 15641 TaxID=1298594 RepID=A0A2S7Z9S8_9FIRM|nr:energy-coupling factor transporter ATPase [Veillonella denticariosi JCM 15641]